MTRSSLFLGLIFVLALAGHAMADKAQEIIGRWEFLEARHGSTVFKTAKGEKNLVAEFRKDGTFTEGPRSGNYRILDENILRLTYTVNGKAGTSQDYQIRIVGDSLTTKNKDRAKFAPETLYVRAK